MLRSELTRNWTRPNPTIRLTRPQKKELETRGKELNALAAKIGAYFRIVYVTADETPLSVRFHLPAVRINRGVWETLDRRAFAFSGRPLMTLDWYRARRVAIAADHPRPAAIPYWDYCSSEGFSGDVDVEDACASWDFGNKFVTYQNAAAPCGALSRVTTFSKGHRMSTISTDPIIVALLALQSAKQTVDTDTTALQTAQAASTNAQAAVAAAQTQLTADQAAAQTAATSVVVALSNAGYDVSLPAPPTGN